MKIEKLILKGYFSKKNQQNFKMIKRKEKKSEKFSIIHNKKREGILMQL